MNEPFKFASTKDFENLFDELFPICRSITGNGYRKSLSILQKFIPFEIRRFPSGSQVFDWTVPPEWNINDAYIVTPEGKKIAEFSKHNLHVVNYSEPIDREIAFDELNEHLHSIPSSPDLIPYVTSYYKRTWGFCLTHEQRQALTQKGKYKVFIDSELKEGSVDIGIAKLASTVDPEAPIVLLGSYLCHPSMANNELSGPLILSALYERIKSWKKRRLNYLFVINPETIGSICLLSELGTSLKQKMHSGLVLTCLGGESESLTYTMSRMGRSPLDGLSKHLSEAGYEIILRDFDPSDGSDERQYCSSGFNLPVGQVARTVYGHYREYHTSGDDKAFVKLDGFLKTTEKLEKFLKLNDANRCVRRKQPYCEIQLGKRGLYPNLNSPLTWNDSADDLHDHRDQFKAITYILSYADGENDLIKMSEQSKLPIEFITKIVDLLESKDLLEEFKYV
jgi:aminopeptidase-like protein